MVELKGGSLGFPLEVIIIFWNQAVVMTLEHTLKKTVKLVWFNIISHISEGIIVSTENQQVTEIGVGRGGGRLEFSLKDCGL